MKSIYLVYIILTIVAISAVITLIPAQADKFIQLTMNLGINPTSGAAPLTVQFSLSLNTNYTSIEWSFGDGSRHVLNTLTTSHTYQKSGNFTGTVGVIAKDGATQSKSFSIGVGAVPTTIPKTITNQTSAHQLLNVTKANTPPILVTSDLKSYNQGDTIIIKGTVRDIENQTAITVRVFNSIKNLVSIGQFTPTSTGSFSDIIKANGPLWTQAGNYTIIAQYGKYQNAIATFYYNGGNGQIIANTPVIKDTFQINAGGQTYSVPYTIKGATVKSMNIYADKLTLEITIAATTDGAISVNLPRSLMDAKVQGGGTNPSELPDDKFIVMINGAPVQFTESKDSNSRYLSIPFHASDTKIDIIGTQIVPEFGPIAALVLAIAIISIIAVSAKTGLRFMPKY